MEKLFQTGTPVTGKDFVGRQEELYILKTLLGMGQSVVLSSPRRYGKTSLILETLERLGKEYFTVYIDLFKITNKRQFAETIIDQVFLNKRLANLIRQIKTNWLDLLKRVEFKAVFEKFETTLRLVSGSSDDELFTHALDLPEQFAKRYSKPIVVALDEFSDVVKLNGDAMLKEMRAHFQMHENTAYVFSGSHESLMNDLFTTKRAAFYKFATMMPLNSIDRNEFCKYILKRFKAQDIMIGKDAAMTLLDKTMCHPYCTLKVCQFLYLSIKGEKDRVDIRDVDNGFNMAVLSERSYMDSLWERLKSRKHLVDVIRVVAQSLPPYEALHKQIERQYVYNALNTLMNMGLVRKTGKGSYEMHDPFLMAHILNTIP